MVFPVILGKGKRLFVNEDTQTSMHLVVMKPAGDEGIYMLIYHPLKGM
jgi:hypothetical protein